MAGELCTAGCGWCGRCDAFPDEEEIEQCPHDRPLDDCDECVQRDAEAAQERFVDRFYGSDQPVTMDEQYQDAATKKRAQR